MSSGWDRAEAGLLLVKELIGTSTDFRNLEDFGSLLIIKDPKACSDRSKIGKQG